MKANIEKKLIYCSECNKWYKAGEDTYLNILFEKTISCVKDHLLGYVWDYEFGEMFDRFKNDVDYD